jgi:hypothetical protein
MTAFFVPSILALELVCLSPCPAAPLRSALNGSQPQNSSQAEKTGSIFCKIFFERLARVDPQRDTRPEKPIINIWGIGGIGKTSLVKKAAEEFGSNLSNLRYIFLDLDHDRWMPSAPISVFFWHLRCQLWDARIETPLFDYLYFTLWRSQHPRLRPSFF